MKLDQKVIGKKIAIERLKKNMTQLELSLILNINEEKLNLWESGEELPNIEEFVNICITFDIEFNDILGIYSNSTNSNALDQFENDITSEILNIIQKQVNTADYIKWFNTTKILHYKNKVKFFSKNQFQNDWIIQRYSDLIKKTVKEFIQCNTLQVEFHILNE